ALTAQAQTTPLAPLDPADVLTRTYSADTSAEAVVLNDYGRAYLDKGEDGRYQVNYTRHTRIKILKKPGYNQATVNVYFRRQRAGEEESVRDVEGRTHNANGSGGVQSASLGMKDVFEEKLGEGYFVKRFTLPDVHEGSVVEFSYRLVSDFVFNIRDYDFQRDIPVRRSDYELSLPPGFEYRVLFQGFESLVVDESQRNLNDGVRYHWAMQNLPALREEPYLTNAGDYVAKVRFELVRVSLPGQSPRTFSQKWEDLDRTLLSDENFGGALNRTNFLTDLGKSLAQQFPDTLARINAVHEHLKRHLTWNGQHRIWTETSLKNAYERRTGNAGEVNLTLVGLLREAGLEAHPVVLSTRAHGKIPTDYPLLSWFNHVVALTRVGGRDLLLDATSPLLPPDMLPLDCLNETGRLIHIRRPRWVSLRPRQRSTLVHTLAFTIKPNGSLSGTVETALGGYQALRRRTDVQAEGWPAFLLKGLPAQFPDFTLSEARVENADSLHRLLVVRCSLKNEGSEHETVGRFYLTPLLLGAQHENPFKSPTRKFPVDFGAPIEETCLVTYTLPEGYAVEEAPKPVSLALPNNDGRFMFSTTQTGNQLVINSRLTLRKTSFTGDEYPTLRAFFDKIVAKHAEKVVLKRE
ncbi:MAG: DUF3857 domain-containing protein, partial [Sphingobacteriaceae bacterium]|nr:DUF3857 domain-containing protein [Cytophagaceae bacterium]